MNNLIIDGKEINQPGSSSAAKFIFSVAYAYHAKKRNPKTGRMELNANLDSHEELHAQIESLEIFLNDSLSGVGEALAIQDALSNEAIQKLGFLISGLADLQALVSDTRNLVNRGSHEHF
ncbi:hypothetical protein AU255_09175 [Methyloprofundus sedimenti]|uniref:Uncharacterized protein n=1 Tax=Methyloprofundus sedimenti TaxID=1420851 RepID=A0A1V8M8Y6_9GAMM|nr:hypothetical protein [Methyloprofundus sedimenti]OQK18009.1 hypothetical protein AU255_09175 [Methyloprofundus sedimenti]